MNAMFVESKRHNRRRRDGSREMPRWARQVAAGALSWLILVQPLLAQSAGIEADGAAAEANRPGLDVAANGVPVVNIVTPNDAGVSHNKYSQFNVDTSGAILNNAKEELSQSQLGGLVQGNANLADSAAASLILNEITSTNRSLLEGAVEVHGAAADVVLANPNGITCNGCGFINTPRVTLATGTPELGDDGALENLQIEGGDIAIGAAFDLQAADIFDLMAGRIRLAGAVRAGGVLNLIAGRNSYGYTSGLVTALTPDGSVGGLAIDSTLLGGMYAARIRLLSTGVGAGVRLLGPLSATAEGITLTADGQLVLADAQAAAGIEAASVSDEVQVTGVVHAGTDVVLDGETAVSLEADAVVAAAGDVTLDGETVTVGSGALAAAGVDAEGVQSATGILKVTAATLNAGAGQLAAGELLEVSAGAIDLRREADTGEAALQSQGDIVLNTDSITASNGRVMALGALSVSSDDVLTLTDGVYTAGKTVNVGGTSVTTSAGLSAAETVTLNARAGDVTNSGRVSGDTGTVVTASGAVSNSGSLLSMAEVTVTAGGAFENLTDGMIVGDGGVTLTAASVNNAGRMLAQGGSLQIDSGGGLTNSGTLGSLTSAALNVDGAIVNSGDLLVEQALVLSGLTGTHAGALTNQAEGTINSGSGTYAVASLDNAGSLIVHDTVPAGAGGALVVEATGDLTNTGLLYSGTWSRYRLDGSFTNTGGTVRAGTDLTIAGLSGARSGALINSSGTISAVAGDLTVKAASISNDRAQLTVETTTASGTETTPAGTITTITETESVSEESAAALLFAGNDLVIESGAVSNRYGRIAAQGGMRITAESLTNTGRALVETTETTTVTEQADGTTTSETATSTQTIDVVGTIEAVGALTATLETTLTNSGQMLSQDQVIVTAKGALENLTVGRMAGSGGVQLTGSSLTNAGLLAAQGGMLTVSLEGGLSNAGRLLSVGGADLNVDGAIVNSGEVMVEDTLAVRGASGTHSGALSNQAGATMSSGSGTYAVASLGNAGSLIAHETTMTIDVTGDVSNTGSIAAETDATFTVAGAMTNSGSMLAEGELSLHGRAGGRMGALRTTTGSTLNGGAGLAIKAASLTNGGGTGSAEGAVDVEVAGNLTNTGLLYSGSSAHFKLDGEFTNTEADVIAETDLTIEGLDNPRAAGLTNRSATIEAVSGDMTLKVTEILNERLVFIVGQLEAEPVVTGPVYGRCTVFKTN